MHRYWWWCSSSSTRRGRDRLVNIPRPISRCTSVQRSPLAERIATRAFDEKSRHRPWIFFTSTTLKPNPGEFPSIIYRRWISAGSFPRTSFSFPSLHLPFISYHLYPRSSRNRIRQWRRWILIGVGNGRKKLRGWNGVAWEVAGEGRGGWRGKVPFRRWIIIFRAVAENFLTLRGPFRRCSMLPF